MAKAAEDFREKLYTIDRAGNRLWVYPQIVPGFYRQWRKVVAAILLVVYLGLPWIEIGGAQAVFLDLVHREFTFFGTTFFASDTEFLVVILGGLGFSLFFVTAIFGRAWCGWVCPETVFLEFVYRPIETWCEGNSALRRKRDGQPLTAAHLVRKGIKWLLFAFVSWWLATTALAYFVGAKPMLEIISGSPWSHPALFIFTLVWMAGLLFQFGWFREQFCSVICPYARFQSVLMDSKSLIVGYDTERGEPRGKNTGGSCIDCGSCVRVCPTGIDIRNGLQLECIQCTACADACDAIMRNIGQPEGLVRYTTQEKLEGKKHGILRPRVIVYAVILTAYALIFGWLLSTRPSAEVRILRKFAGESPYTQASDGKLMNRLDAHITNKSKKDLRFTVQPSSNKHVQILTPVETLIVHPGQLEHLPIFLTFDAKEYPKQFEIVIVSDDGYTSTNTISLIGPDL